MPFLYAAIGAVVGVALGFFVGFLIRKKVGEAKIGSAEAEAKKIVEVLKNIFNTRFIMAVLMIRIIPIQQYHFI